MDLPETLGQRVLEKVTRDSPAAQGLRPGPPGYGGDLVIFPAEHPTVVHRDPVDVPGEVAQEGLWAPVVRSGDVDDPALLTCRYTDVVSSDA